MPWAIWHKNKVVELGDTMINTIRWDPLMIYGWTDKDLMKAWSFIFPLTNRSRKDGCLPLIDSAWYYTPNPWWWLTLNRPSLLPPRQMTSNTSRTLLESVLSEASLDLIERELALLKVYQTEESTGVLIQGILPQLKLIQTIIATRASHSGHWPSKCSWVY